MILVVSIVLYWDSAGKFIGIYLTGLANVFECTGVSIVIYCRMYLVCIS